MLELWNVKLERTVGFQMEEEISEVVQLQIMKPNKMFDLINEVPDL